MINLWEPNVFDQIDQVSCFHDHEGDEGEGRMTLVSRRI